MLKYKIPQIVTLTQISGVYFKLNCPIKKEVFLNVQKHFLF